MKSGGRRAQTGERGEEGSELRSLSPEPLEIPVQRLPEGHGLPLPDYASGGSAGMDLIAAVQTDVRLMPGERALVPTGIAVAIPPGYEAQIRPRSGLALKCGLTLANSPGTVDSDYRGPVQVVMINLGSEAVTIHRGDRIAQMVVAPVVRAKLVESDALPETSRGSGGFGHTGT